MNRLIFGRGCPALTGSFRAVSPATSPGSSTSRGHWICTGIRDTGLAYFLKQLGAYVFRGNDRVRLHDRHGGDWTEWPDDVPRIRQMPLDVVKIALTNHERNITPVTCANGNYL